MATVERTPVRDARPPDRPDVHVVNVLLDCVERPVGPRRVLSLGFSIPFFVRRLNGQERELARWRSVHARRSMTAEPSTQLKGREMRQILTHVRHQGVAYVALFVALGGTTYAATSLPTGSVGAAQLRDGSLTPRKLNSSLIGGYIRAWAHVSSTGHVIAGSPGAEAFYRALTGTTLPGPNYFVGWSRAKLSGRCSPIVTLDENGPVGSRGSTVEASMSGPEFPKVRSSVAVVLANAADQNVPDNFVVAVVC